MRSSLKVIMFGAVLMLGSIVCGVGGTVLGMIISFNNVAKSGADSASAELTDSIQRSLVSTYVAVPVMLIGLGLLVGGLIAYFTGNEEPRAKEKTEKQADEARD